MIHEISKTKTKKQQQNNIIKPEGKTANIHTQEELWREMISWKKQPATISTSLVRGSLHALKKSPLNRGNNMHL